MVFSVKSYYLESHNTLCSCYRFQILLKKGHEGGLDIICEQFKQLHSGETYNTGEHL